MTSALARRLQAFTPLPQADLDLINELSAHPRLFRAGKNIIHEGDKPGDVHLIARGIACRYKQLATEKRQIVAYLLAGEFCDLHVFVLAVMDHSISAINDCEVVKIPRPTILEMLDRPALARALIMTTLVDEATLRDWIANIGARPARNRLAHFFCEIYMRMKTIDAVDGPNCELPINQSHLAQTVGLSLVHVNKSLRILREEGAVEFKDGTISILDSAKLQKIADFKMNYLHLRDAGQ